MRLAIGIPTINRLDLLQKSLEDLSQNFSNLIKDFVIIDNGNQDIKIPDNLPQEIIRPAKNQGCGGSWSMIMDHFIDRDDIDHILMPSDDVCLGKEFANNLDEIFANEYDILLPEEHYHWSTVAISKQCWKEVGRFDPVFWPAYHEDWDYSYRAELAGRNIHRTNLMNPGTFINSASSQKDRTLINPRTGYHYQLKWGGMRGSEQYSEPYNGDKELENVMKDLGLKNLGVLE